MFSQCKVEIKIGDPQRLKKGTKLLPKNFWYFLPFFSENIEKVLIFLFRKIKINKKQIFKI